MPFGNYYGGFQPATYAPGGAMPDMLNQYKQPYQMPMQQQPAPAHNQGNNGLIWVQGESGAKSFFVSPGQSALLMDSEAMRFYLKSADTSGMPMPLRVFEYSEVSAQQQAQAPVSISANYVTRDEFEARLAQISKPAKKAEKSEKAKEETENE